MHRYKLSWGVDRYGGLSCSLFVTVVVRSDIISLNPLLNPPGNLVLWEMAITRSLMTRETTLAWHSIWNIVVGRQFTQRKTDTDNGQ